MTALHEAAVQTLIARSYLRVSEDRKGQRASTSQQDTENTRAMSGQGWVQGEPYRDDGKSASRYARGVRDDFQRLVEDLREDQFGADVLVLWETSRGSREMWEWVMLMDLLAAKGVLVHVTTHWRTYDPRNHRDRKTLLEDGIDNEAESAKVSMRTTRDAAALAAAGKPTGKIPVGYLREYDPRTGALLRQAPDPETAPFIRELFERLEQGHTLNAIARDFAERGLTNGKGEPYSSNHLRTLARTHAYTGLRVHVPGRKTRVPNREITDEHLIEAAWEPIVSRDLFYKVQGLLNDPARRTSRPGRANHLLSMIARCDVCEGPLVFRNHPTRNERLPALCCRNGHVRVPEADLDRLVERYMLDYLGSETLAEDIAAKEADGADLRTARAEVGKLRAKLQQIEDLLDSGEMSPELAARSDARTRKALTQAEARERDLSTPSELRGLIEPGPGVEDRWAETPLAAQRRIATILLSPDTLGELRVLPSPVVGSRPPIKDRVRFRKEE